MFSPEKYASLTGREYFSLYHLMCTSGPDGCMPFKNKSKTIYKTSLFVKEAKSLSMFKQTCAIEGSLV